MSTDLERELRDLLSAEAGSAPPPHDAPVALRRTRRRQALAAVTAVCGVAVVIAAATVGLRLLDRSPDSTPAGATRTEIENGVSITFPEGWSLIDPNDAGLTGPTGTDAAGLPRMILALAPFDPGELFGCPPLATTRGAFLMELQERPLAVAGPNAAPWPVELEPLDLAVDDVGCYEGWEILGAVWTASGRTFEVGIGFAPDVSDADRAGLLAAFASMTFAPAEEPATSVVIGTGETGGEAWELIASRGADGLELSVQAGSWGGGVGVSDPSSFALGFVEHEMGSGPDAERLAFAAIPSEVATFEIDSQDGSFAAEAQRIDVPDEIDARFDAVVVEFPPGAIGRVRLLDADGNVVATGEIGRGEDGSGVGPAGPDVPPAATPIEHGGTYWALYLALAADANDPAFADWSAHAEAAGYATGPGDLACDEGAADGLGVPPEWFGVAVYFSTLDDAEAARAWFGMTYGEPAGIARVTTFCLD
jgi:hypothetical protein